MVAILDRKSTRLNSSHQIISYAVFCLKKKKTSINSSDKIRTNVESWSHKRQPPPTATNDRLYDNAVGKDTNLWAVHPILALHGQCDLNQYQSQRSSTVKHHLTKIEILNIFSAKT